MFKELLDEMVSDLNYINRNIDPTLLPGAILGIIAIGIGILIMFLI